MLLLNPVFVVSTGEVQVCVLYIGLTGHLFETSSCLSFGQIFVSPLVKYLSLLWPNI